MKTRKDMSKTGGTKKNGLAHSVLGRKASAVKRQQKKQAITAAMEYSQRKGADQTARQIPAAFGRAVEKAERRLKKETITRAMASSQRERGAQGKPTSELLQRKVAADKRRRKKEAVTAAMKESQRRRAPRGS